MVELAALEKRYGAIHRGFESLPLRHDRNTRPRDVYSYRGMKEFEPEIERVRTASGSPQGSPLLQAVLAKMWRRGRQG